MAKRKGFIVHATVCDTIKSVPVEREQARRMARETKRRIPRSKVKVTKA